MRHVESAMEAPSERKQKEKEEEAKKEEWALLGMYYRKWGFVMWENGRFQNLKFKPQKKEAPRYTKKQKEEDDSFSILSLFLKFLSFP